MKANRAERTTTMLLKPTKPKLKVPAEGIIDAVFEKDTILPDELHPKKVRLDFRAEGYEEVSSIASCRALRKAISKLSKELEAAGAEGKAIQRRELEALILKLKGRLRVEQHEKVTGPAELDRKAVLKALLAWFKHLRGVHAALAEHLKKSITKGYECAYRPSDGEITWRLSAGTMPSVKEHAPSGGAE